MTTDLNDGLKLVAAQGAAGRGFALLFVLEKELLLPDQVLVGSPVLQDIIEGI